MVFVCMFWSSCFLSPGLPAPRAPYLSSLRPWRLNPRVCRSQTVPLCRLSGGICVYSEVSGWEVSESLPLLTSTPSVNVWWKQVIECVFWVDRDQTVLPGWITPWSNKMRVQGTLESLCPLPSAIVPLWLRNDTGLNGVILLITCWSKVILKLFSCVESK